MTLNPLTLLRRSQQPDTTVAEATPDPDSAGQLAAEMAEAKQMWNDTRADIIHRGTERVSAIEVMRAELDLEQEAIELVLTEAGVVA